MFKRFLNYLKKDRRWIYLVVVFIVALFGVFYYFKIYIAKPSFSDEQSIFIYSDKGEYLKPGEEITYTIKFKNTGNRNIEDLVIELKVPENTSFVSSDRNNILINDDRTLAFEIGSVKRNEVGSINFIVEADKPLDNGTLIKLDGVKFKYRAGKDLFNDDIGADLVSRIESSPDLNNFKLEAVDENGDIVMLGDVIQYNLTVENTGDMDASDVEIKSSLSEYVNIIEDSINGSGEYKDDHVIWKVNNIEINRPRTFSFKVKVKDDLGGEELITNQGTLRYGSIVIEKSVEEKLSLFSDLATSEVYLYDANGRELWPGETVTVKVTVRNTGDMKEENYRVICPIPAEATYISGSGTPEGISWSDDIRGLIWDLQDLGMGEEKEITFSMKVNDNLAGMGGVVTTHFRIESNNGEIELPPKSLNVKGNVNLTIVAMGDSLIEMSNWVQTFDGLLEANYPYAEYNTIASGKGGEMARGGYERFDSTVAVYNPDIIIIAYGTNDVGPRASGFTSSIEGLIIKAKNLNARVFINLIGPIYRSGKEGYAPYNEVIKQIAAKHGVVVIDVLTPLSQNPGEYLVDGMHYSPAGASVVAHTVFSYVSNYLGSVGQRL
jgi:uncharacterized repeat protein (TIGR01451 family)